MLTGRITPRTDSGSPLHCPTTPAAVYRIYRQRRSASTRRQRKATVAMDAVLLDQHDALLLGLWASAAPSDATGLQPINARAGGAISDRNTTRHATR